MVQFYTLYFCCVDSCTEHGSVYRSGDDRICDDSDETRTHKIFNALEEICYEFDLSKPIWLDVTIAEFKKHAKARFYQDNFVDSIDFDYLEIQVIEE